MQFLNLNNNFPKIESIKQPSSINVHYDTLLNVEGNVDKSIDINSMINNALDKSNAKILRLMNQHK
jgi:hypothetical protein